MSALGDTVGNFRSLGAAAARLVADLLDGPEPCVHDLSEDVEWSRGWDRGWRSAEEAYGVGRCETRRAEGTQHAQAPGEVSADPSPDPAPSPGDYSRMPDSQLYARAASAVFDAARCTPKVLEINALINLGEALLDRSAQLAAVEAEPFVAQEDLAAHITAIRNAWRERWQGGETNELTLSDEIARDLVSNYFIAKK